MFENPRGGRQARNFTTNVPKILVLKSSSEQIFSRKLPLGTPGILRAEDKSDRVCSSCGRKMKTLHQLYSFVSSALFSSESGRVKVKSD